MERWFSKLDLLPFFKLKIIFINLFCVLYKAATLNLSNLLKDVRDVEKAFQSQISIPVYVIKILIPFFLTLKFVVGFFSLATRVIAMLPILSDDHPEMLLPCMIAQLIEKLLLPLFELILGFTASKYTESDCTPMLLVFTISLGVKLAFGVAILNVYMNFYSKMLVNKSLLTNRSPIISLPEEVFFYRESLS